MLNARRGSEECFREGQRSSACCTQVTEASHAPLHVRNSSASNDTYAMKVTCIYTYIYTYIHTYMYSCVFHLRICSFFIYALVELLFLYALHTYIHTCIHASPIKSTSDNGRAQSRQLLGTAPQINAESLLGDTSRCPLQHWHFLSKSYKNSCLHRHFFLFVGRFPPAHPYRYFVCIAKGFQCKYSRLWFDEF